MNSEKKKRYVFSPDIFSVIAQLTLQAWGYFGMAGSLVLYLTSSHSMPVTPRAVTFEYVSSQKLYERQLSLA